MTGGVRPSLDSFDDGLVVQIHWQPAGIAESPELHTIVAIAAAPEFGHLVTNPGRKMWRVGRADSNTRRPVEGDIQMIFESEDSLSEWVLIKGLVALHKNEPGFWENVAWLGNN